MNIYILQGSAATYKCGVHATE